jgi:hypothetical protein
MLVRRCIYKRYNICTLRGDCPYCCYEISKPILFLYRVFKRKVCCIYEEPFFKD